MLLRNFTTLPGLFLLLLTTSLVDAAPKARQQSDPQAAPLEIFVGPGYRIPLGAHGEPFYDMQCTQDNTGPKFKRGYMLDAADALCTEMHGKTLPDGSTGEDGMFIYSHQKTYDIHNPKNSQETIPSLYLIAYIAVIPGLLWRIDRDTCNAMFKRITDGCDTYGEDVKEGGILKWAGAYFYLKGNSLVPEEW